MTHLQRDLHLVKTGLDKFFPDANAELQGKLNAAAAQISNEFALQVGQLKINEVEAASGNLFVSGARPAIMWICAITLLYSGVGISFLTWVGHLWGWPPLPIVDSATTNNVLMGLLGLGTMRTVEKINGVARK